MHPRIVRSRARSDESHGIAMEFGSLAYDSSPAGWRGLCSACYLSVLEKHTAAQEWGCGVLGLGSRQTPLIPMGKSTSAGWWLGPWRFG